MAITKLTQSTSALSETTVVNKLKEMNTEAEKHGHSMIAKKGDGQHAKDILWQLKKGTSLVKSGSMPMTTHTIGDGGKNLKAAITALNSAIDYVNDLS